MIDLSQFNDAPGAVVGLGRTGLTTSRALMDSGVEVWAWDDDSDARDQAQAVGLPLTDLYNCRWEQVHTLALSPGVPHTYPEPHPIARLARDSGCAIIGDMELLFRSSQEASYLGVTGTNGKSTTTALIGHILKQNNIETRVGGNIGSPVLALEPLPKDGYYVLEMSSYQLELTPSATFNIAVLLNISADHLDRHGGMAGYIAAKKQIFANQTSSNIAVIGIDDPHSESIYTSLKSEGLQQIIPISSMRRVKSGAYVLNGMLFDNLDGQNREVLDLRGISALPGVHNWQNAAAAYAATKAAGADEDRIIEGLRTYPGLPHRQELIAVIDGISYINDSKATNAEATARALACYDMICWIAGGRTKGDSLDLVKPYADRIVMACLIGEAVETFAKELPGSIVVDRCGTLDVAVQRARQCALQENKNGNVVVLLSPACASFDQFKNFEERGNAFRHLVEALPGLREDISSASLSSERTH